MSDETTSPTEDRELTARIHANGKALAWGFYEASAMRHIALQRKDRGARKLALLLNPPGYNEEMDAAAALAGGIFAERAACVAAVRALLDTADESGKATLEGAVKAILARGPVRVTPEWETSSTEEFTNTSELFVATPDEKDKDTPPMPD